MWTKQAYISVIATVLLLTSCAKPLLTAIDNHDRIKLDQTTLNRLTGDYEIMTIDTLRTTLPSSFMNDKTFHFENLPGKDDKVSIEIIDGNKMKMTLIDNGQVIKQKTIKFKLTDNYIEYRRNYISLFLVIINGSSSTQARIGLLTNGNITMDMSFMRMGFLGLIPFTGGSTVDYNLIYARKNGSR